MKTRLFTQIFILGLLTLLLVPQTSIGEDVVIPPSSIKIDSHLVDVFQQDDLKTFKIDQKFYINNTGNASFNDSFYIWVPENSMIIADCCNGIFNMACRYDAKDEMWCFYFNKTDDKNIYVGYPISNGSKLSYYGQRESFTITAFSTSNSSLRNDTLQLNATIGGSFVSRENDSFQGFGVHITSENQMIGMIPWMAPYKSFNITSFETIRVFNNGSDNETIEISINDLPEGWRVEIWNETKKLNNISLSPQENVNLTLVITAPSYLAEIFVEFTTQTGIDENETQGSFKNKYLYETKYVAYQILSTSEKLNVSKDLLSAHDAAYWLEDYGRYWYLATAENIQANNESTISLGFKMKIPPNESPSESNPFIMGVLALIIILIIVVLILKKKDYFKEKDDAQSKKTPSKKRKTKQSEIEDKGASKKKEKEIKDLEEQKKKVLSAIKRVESEFEDGIINKKDYERLRDTYKKQAIKILKEIDHLEE